MDLKYNILIVDDMAVNRKLIKAVLYKNIEDINFIEAEDGVRALELVKERNIDLIILDLMMPEKDGYVVLQEMNESEGIKEIPVIVNSAVLDMDSIKRTLELGAVDYFTKPLTPDQMKVILPLKVKNALEHNEQRKRLNDMNHRMKEELNIAKILQKTLLAEYKEFRAGKMYGTYIACTELGGDIYDCVEIGDKLWFIIADVAGHGVASAMVASMVKIMFDYCIAHLEFPSEVMSVMNKTFFNMMKEYNSVIFSAFIGVIENDRLTYSNAGHPHPVLFDGIEGTTQMLEQNGSLIGIFEETTHEDRQIVFNDQSALFLYTDGLFENKTERDLISVYDYCVENAHMIYDSSEYFNKSIIKYFSESGNNKFKDDVAVVLICRK